MITEAAKKIALVRDGGAGMSTVLSMATFDNITPGDIILYKKTGLRTVVTKLKRGLDGRRPRRVCWMKLRAYGRYFGYGVFEHWVGTKVGLVPESALQDEDAMDEALRAATPVAPAQGEVTLSYFAIRDPHDSSKITLWAENRRWRSVPPSQKYRPWPARNRLPGPKPTDFSAGKQHLTTEEWTAYEVAQWHYRRAVETAISQDPLLAASRFASLATACCMCGRALTEDQSKSYGIGPECRSKVPKAIWEQAAERMRALYGSLPAEKPFVLLNTEGSSTGT